MFMMYSTSYCLVTTYGSMECMYGEIHLVQQNFQITKNSHMNTDGMWILEIT
jgi:hypothetical protein